MFTQRKCNIVKNTEIGEERAKLEQHAHPAAGRKQSIWVELADVLAVKQDLAVLGSHLAADQAQDSGLAAAGSAHQCSDLAPRDGETHVLQDGALAIAEADVAAFDKGSEGIGHPGQKGPGNSPADDG